MPSANAGSVNVLIVDDDPVYRRILVHSFSKIEGCSVIGAVDSISAAQDALRKYDVRLITLDVVMNGESGLDILPWLSKNFPKVVVALLTAGQEKRASQAIDAVLLGAVALIIKPSGHGAPETLLSSLNRVIGAMSVADRAVSAVPSKTLARPEKREIIAIGSSTGGPPMLQTFLRTLVPACQTPIIVTQHIASAHVANLVGLLDGTNSRRVVAACDGASIVPKTVYIASQGKHLTLRRENGSLIIRQDDGPEENFCRPAVDPMFRSVADICGRAAVAIVMTGMGVDGALGALACKKREIPVIVQDKESSVVWGMPGAAVAHGAASFIVSGNQIAIKVAELIAASPMQVRSENVHK